MSVRQRGPERYRGRRDQDKVNVVGHQAPGQATNTLAPARFRDQVAVGRIILAREEDFLAAIAALRDVMGDIGNDDARKAGHASLLWAEPATVN